MSRPFGSKNHKAKLTERRAQIIREYFILHKRPLTAERHPSWVTVKEIAKRVHMAESAIRDLVKGKTWTHI